MSFHTIPKGFQDYVKRKGYLHQCHPSILGLLTYILYLCGPLNCQHGCRRQTGAECGVGQSGGGAPSTEQATTGGHLGDMETDSRGVRFHNSNHCLISNSTVSCPFCWYTLSSNEHRKSRCNSLQHSSFVISLHQYYRVADKCFSNILQYQNNSHESIHYSDLRIRARGGMTQSNKYVIAGGFIDPKKSLTLIYNDWL